jgi:hypothetical protein
MILKLVAVITCVMNLESIILTLFEILYNLREKRSLNSAASLGYGTTVYSVS